MSQKNDSKNKTKSKTKSKTKKSTKTSSETAWASVISTSVLTIIFFWVLFPFYSYQLQIIFDQRQCKGSSKNDKTQGGGESCPLPHNKHNAPYYPCPNGELLPNSIQGKQCPEEHVKGPDMFSMFLTFCRSAFRDLYSIAVGESWIKADKIGKQAEAKLKEQKSSSGESKETSGGSKRDIRKNYTQTGGENPRNVKTNQTMLKTNLQNKKPSSTPEKPESSKSTPMSVMEKAMEKSFGISSSTIKKHSNNSTCCSRLKKYGLDEELGKCESKDIDISKLPPFNMFSIKNFGWPYYYIYDDPSVEEPTAYNPNGTNNEAGMTRWFMAWFAKTQQRAWSSIRSILSAIFSLFLPYLHEHLSYFEILKRIEKYIDELQPKDKEGKIIKNDTQKRIESFKTTHGLNNVKASELNDKVNALESILKKYKNAHRVEVVNNKTHAKSETIGKQTDGRELLFKVLSGTHSQGKLQIISEKVKKIEVVK